MSLASHQACSYAIFLLADDGQAITAANIQKVLAAAKLTKVESYLPKLYASNVTLDVFNQTVANGGQQTGGAPIAPAAAATAAKDEKKAPAKEEKKEEKEKEVEEDIDMGDLFG